MSDRLLVHGGHVFDPASGAAHAADVAIEDGRIAAIGSGLDGDRAIDASGDLVLPGLIDCHVHVTLSDVDILRLIQQPFSLRFFQAADHLRRTLATGVTTVRDAAGADLGIKQALADGLIAGPDIRIAIGMISQTGGHGDEWMASGECVQALWPSHPGCPATVVDGVDAVRRKVRELVRAGADVIKVATTGGGVSPRSDPRHAHFADDELAVLVAEARAAQLRVMAHAHGTEGIKSALRAGIRSIEHGVHLDDEAVAMMLERRAWLVPTLSAPHALLRRAREGAALTEPMRRKLDGVVEALGASVRLAHEAGVPIAMGSDAGIGPHGDNLRELELLTDHGLSDAEALRAATSTAAALLGEADTIGDLAPGKRADLVIARGTELSVRDLRARVRTVVQGGRIAAGDQADP